MDVLKILALTAFLVVLAGAGWLVGWVNTPAMPMQQALDFMQTTQEVKVDEGEYITFSGLNANNAKGIIFYPGGRVDPKAYAPLMFELAKRGAFTVIVPMPFNLAVFSPMSASRVIKRYPYIKDWYIAGHSLGGAMACSFVKNSMENIAGLILLAAYPAQGDDLSSNDLDVLSIYASNDGLATVQKIESTKRLLPPQTEYCCIQGGNHNQFGWYLNQEGDGQADISRQQQQDEALSYILEFIGNQQ